MKESVPRLGLEVKALITMISKIRRVAFEASILQNTLQTKLT